MRLLIHFYLYHFQWCKISLNLIRRLTHLSTFFINFLVGYFHLKYKLAVCGWDIEGIKIIKPNWRNLFLFCLKMAERAWNWESKVERLRQILEKQALERTCDVCESARSTDLFSVENISEVKKIEFFFLCILINFWVLKIGSWIFLFYFGGVDCWIVKFIGHHNGIRRTSN